MSEKEKMSLDQSLLSFCFFFLTKKSWIFWALINI